MASSESENGKQHHSFVPSNSTCLVCDVRVGTTQRSINIFQTLVGSSCKKYLANILSSILSHSIKNDNVHSCVVCNICYRLLVDIDEVEIKLNNMKHKVKQKYKETLTFWNQEIGKAQQENIVIVISSVVDGDVPTEQDRECFPSSTENVLENATTTADESRVEKELEVIVIKTDPTKERESNYLLTQVNERETNEKCINKEGDQYVCLLCHSKFPNVKFTIEHFKRDHNKTLYLCHVCNLDFTRKADFMCHMVEHEETKDGDFQCEVCEKMFKNSRDIKKHKIVEHKANLFFACSECGETCTSQDLLDKHLQSHAETVSLFKCEECLKCFRLKSNYNAHMKHHLEQSQLLKCPHCPKTFSSSQRHVRHMRVHTQKNNFACDSCDKKFASANSLKVHKMIHSGYKPYICSVCGKAFTRKMEVDDHERTHSGEKPFQCEICGTSFGKRSNLRLHKRATHFDDRRYKCDMCGRGFKRRRLLDYHTKSVHTGERPHKCELCNAAFVYPGHLKKHMLIHTGIKPYKCEICGKAFHGKDNRNAHRFTHSEKKPYECVACGVGFMRKPQLLTHMKSQGHNSDTIVVNQSSVALSEKDKTMVVFEGNQDLNDTRIYIEGAEQHIIISGEEAGHVYCKIQNGAGCEGEKDEVQHVIIDGQVHFTDCTDVEGLAEETYQSKSDSEKGNARMLLIPVPSHDTPVPGASFCEAKIQSLAVGENVHVKQTNQAIQFIEIKIPDDKEKTNNG